MHLSTALRLASYAGKPVVALTGAGGKSSLLFRLGQELHAAGRATLLTSTTHLAASQANLAPFTLFSSHEALLQFELPVSLQGYGRVLLMAAPPNASGKLLGLHSDLICRLAALPEAEAVVVEADGSRQRPLKAPAAHEPVIPACTTHSISVMGLAALGHPLSERIAHRPQRIAELTGLASGDLITPHAVAALLLHRAGAGQGAPRAARRYAYLNLAGDITRLPAARQIAQQVLAAAPQPYHAVLIGSAQASEPVLEVYGSVAAVVLAAGRSSRFSADGPPKQLASWQPGDTLVGRVADIALVADVQTVVAVTGYQADQVQAALAARPVQCVVNPDWSSGQSSSIAAALAVLPPHTSAALFLLADQPHVHPATLDALVMRHRQSLAPIVAPLYEDGQRGNPVLFDRAAFAELAALQGDTGGRALLARYGAAVETVAVSGPAPQGIETQAAYHAARAAANKL